MKIPLDSVQVVQNGCSVYSHFMQSLASAIVSNVRSLSGSWSIEDRLNGMDLLFSFLSLNKGALCVQHTECAVDALIAALADEEVAIAGKLQTAILLQKRFGQCLERALGTTWILGSKMSRDQVLECLIGATSKRKNLMTSTQKAVLLLMSSTMMEAAAVQIHAEDHAAQKTPGQNTS